MDIQQRPLELIKAKNDANEGEAQRPGPEELTDEEQPKIQKEKELNHFAHEHPLLFIQDLGNEALCFGCGEPIEGSCYCCKSCQFQLHKTCAELQLPLKIRHPSHPPHPLLLFPRPPYLEDINCISLDLEIDHPYHPHPLLLSHESNQLQALSFGCGETLERWSFCCSRCQFFHHCSHPLIYLPETPNPEGYYVCNFCHGARWGSLYHCASCDFSLDINCAMRNISIADDSFPKLEHFSHDHPLIFIEEHDEDVLAFCFGCDKQLSGPIYRCLCCSNFDLHKECAELPLHNKNLNYSHLHRRHPVHFSVDPPVHPEACTCDVCKSHYQGFVYHCYSCNFTRPFQDFFKPTTVTDQNHEHPLYLLQRSIQFICDFCSLPGDCDPYICVTCQLLLHESCTRQIRVNRHVHGLVFRYFLQHNKDDDDELVCSVCYMIVDPRVGWYSCPKPECSYAAHVACARDKYILDGGDDLMKPGPLISAVFENMSPQEGLVATKIKHVYHEHNLNLTEISEVKADNICDGCMSPVSVPFYNCEQCSFFLHEDCAELPRQNQFPIHKHLLTLTKNGFTRCNACGNYHHGFSYKCDRRRCTFKMDLQCGLLTSTLDHPSHCHELALDKNYVGSCSNCHGHISRLLQNGAYRCQQCEYVLDFKCVRLPRTAWYKYEKHDLILACHDDSDPSKLFCDICEEERQPNSWFYYCKHCDNSIHIDCIIGDLPFVKLGSTFRDEALHPHSLTFVKKIYNCLPCNICRKICYSQALECEEPECNFIVHWKCLHEQETDSE